LSEEFFGMRSGAPGDAMSADGTDLDPDIRRFVREVSAAFASHAGFSTMSYPQQREIAAAVRARWAKGGPVMARTRDISVPHQGGAVRVRVHEPALSEGVKPALIYLHGGGWTLFSIETHDRLMREYAARAGIVVIGVDYALSPAHRFPVALDQVIEVVRWAQLGDKAHDLPIDAKRIALGGDSAGGNLALAAALSFREAGESRRLAALVLNYAALDTTCSSDSLARFGNEHYMLGGEEMNQFWSNYGVASAALALNPLICPARAQLHGLPPTHFTIAECDILAEQNIAAAEKMRGVGGNVVSCVYEGASHSFLEAMSIASLSVRAIDDTCTWLGEIFRRPP